MEPLGGTVEAFLYLRYRLLKVLVFVGKPLGHGLKENENEIYKVFSDGGARRYKVKSEKNQNKSSKKQEAQWIHLSKVTIIYDKIGPVVREEKIFKFRECTFAILLISPYVKRYRLSIWTNLNSLHIGILFAKSSWNWPTGSVDYDFNFSLFCSYLPL